MNTFFSTLLIGISLSMDAFSLSILYGTSNTRKKDKLLLAFIVGLYHFFMPLIGVFFGTVISKYLVFNFNILVSVIFFTIGLEMIISNFKEKQERIVFNIIGMIIFGLSVSIDSLSVGIGLKVINSNYLECSIIFSIVSFLFTYLGLNFGNKLSKTFGKISVYFGGFLILILSIFYLFK